MKILIATGDGRLDAALSRIAWRHGCEAIVADDGVSVVALALSLRPPLGVLGESLPVESGWLACAKLRIAGFGGTLVLTGASPRHKVRDLAAAAGAGRYVSTVDCESDLDRALGGGAGRLAPREAPR